MSDPASGRLVLVGVGGALVLGALVSFVRERLRFSRWTATTGVVVGHRVRQTRRDGRLRTQYHPLVRFVVAGRELVFESSLSTSEKRYEEGSAVTMLYDPNDPESACIDDVREKYTLAMFLGAMGTIFTAVGGYLSR